MKTELKKVSVQKIDLAKQPTGFELEGTFLGFTKSEPFQKVDDQGELVTKEITFANFEIENGERVQVAADKGLQSGIRDGGIHEGTWMKAVKLDKVKLKGSKTMNAYDIFTRE